jgi:hypothetical protein
MARYDRAGGGESIQSGVNDGLFCLMSFLYKWSWRWTPIPGMKMPRRYRAEVAGSQQPRTMKATPDDETVVAGSGVPGLFGEAVNELMCPAS